MPLKITGRLEGVEKLTRKLEMLEDVVNKSRMDSSYRQAEELRDIIQQKAPLGPTGNLKRSPVAKKYPPYAIAGVDRKIAPHAHLVEFGTSHSAAHPFLRPSIMQFKDKVPEYFREDIAKKILGAF